MYSLPVFRFLLPLLLLASSLFAQSYDDLVRAASASRASGDAKNAIAVANKAVAVDGARCEAYVVRALSELQIGDYDAARISAEAAIRLAPEDRRRGLQVMLDVDREQRVAKSVAEAKAAVEQKKWARAADAYASAFEASPERGDLGLQAAALFAKIEEHARAIAIAQKLIGSKDAKTKDGATELLRTLEEVVRPKFDAKMAEAKQARD